jgi:hypothetical protein
MTWHDIRSGREQNVPPVGAVRIGSIKTVSRPETCPHFKIYYLSVVPPQQPPPRRWRARA